MRHRSGQDRQKFGLFATPLDKLIAPDNLVHVVEAIKAKHLRVLNNRPKYKRRQAIVEHLFGTIKRSWGFYYTLLEGKEKVTGENTIVLTAYNLRRAISILGVKAMLKAPKGNYFNFLVRKCCVECPYTGFECGALWLAA